jgi:hypothetical protein
MRVQISSAVVERLPQWGSFKNGVKPHQKTLTKFLADYASGQMAFKACPEVVGIDEKLISVEVKDSTLNKVAAVFREDMTRFGVKIRVTSVDIVSAVAFEGAVQNLVSKIALQKSAKLPSIPQPTSLIARSMSPTLLDDDNELNDFEFGMSIGGDLGGLMEYELTQQLGKELPMCRAGSPDREPAKYQYTIELADQLCGAINFFADKADLLCVILFLDRDQQKVEVQYGEFYQPSYKEHASGFTVPAALMADEDRQYELMRAIATELDARPHNQTDWAAVVARVAKAVQS